MITKEKQGISLIVLIITIVVIVILGTAIIVSIAKTNVIENANWSTWISNYRTVEEAERLYENNKIVEDKVIEKVYSTTDEKITPTSTLKETIEKSHSVDYQPELYKMDLERIGVRNITTEYALDKKDGKIYDIKGHKKGKYIYHTPDIKVIAVEDTEAPSDFDIQVSYDEDTGKITVTVGEVTDNLSETFIYEYRFQKVTIDEGTQEEIEDGEAVVAKTSSNTYESDVLEDGNYKVDVNVYDEQGNVKKSNNTETIEAKIVIPDIYVAINGSDDTGDGSKNNPYETIAKAIDSAVDGDKIFVMEGEYELESISQDSYTSVGLYDKSKQIEIYGQNEKTILVYDGSTSSVRDGCAIDLKNSNSKLRNLTYIFKPKSSSNNYSRAIFHKCNGTVENVFFRITGLNKASYLYYNSQSTATNIKNCTFFHDLGEVNSNYSGKCNFTNIATNVTTNGTNTNVITKSFGETSDNILRLIKNSYEDEEFNKNQVGVYFGDNAWKYTGIELEDRTDTIYVSTTGNDYIGSGSDKNPYATLTKAIDSAVDGDKIFITEGEYKLKSVNISSYTGVGIYDNNKQLEIYGENEKTILSFDGTGVSTRDSGAMRLSNANTVVRNLTYIYKPKSSSNNHSKSIFNSCNGTVENVFFRISGSNKASYLYYNDQSTANNVRNCTFFHDLGGVDSNYSGKCNFTNIATNVTTKGTNTNVITKSFGDASTSLVDLIKASKEDADFVSNQAGVFYGDYAWE